MARQYKKIQHKITPPKQPAVKQEKPGKDLFLIVVTCFTFFVLLFGWQSFNIMNRVMYGMLTLSLVLTYAHKHGHFNDNVNKWIDRVSFVSIVVSIALFAVVCYYNYIA